MSGPTRVFFEDLAEALGRGMATLKKGQRDKVVDEVSRVCEDHNPNFLRRRFADAVDQAVEKYRALKPKKQRALIP
ncbi:MAG: hypothetical protein KatS3mg082_1428 [Nitrospiraceae bacterium]|nr:MAG: hypothetical protein KatS3mg082_1428 [Nitrospiraceae bacterium]